MREAIAEALKADASRTRPNPRVGAVIVENGLIVARGFHEKNGSPHAERNALGNLTRRPKSGACMYVTLEPCSTKGRTGACTDAILESGIARVVIGAMDPTPSHRGSAIAILERASVKVVSEVLALDCAGINPGFGGHVTSESE